MKKEERLLESYKVQKQIFDEAENRRISNTKEKLEVLRKKRENLDLEIARLEKRINEKREFESFDSFRQKSLTLSAQSKRA